MQLVLFGFLYQVSSLLRDFNLLWYKYVSRNLLALKSGISRVSHAWNIHQELCLSNQKNIGLIEKMCGIIHNVTASTCEN